MASSFLTLLKDRSAFVRYRSVGLVGDPPVFADQAEAAILKGWGRPVVTISADQDVDDLMAETIWPISVVAEATSLKRLPEVLATPGDIKLLVIWRTAPTRPPALDAIVDCSPFADSGKRLDQYLDLLAEQHGQTLDDRARDIVKMRLGTAQDRIEIEIRKVMTGAGCLSADALAFGLEGHIEAEASVLADAIQDGDRHSALALALYAVDHTDALLGMVGLLASRLKTARAWIHAKEKGQDKREFCTRAKVSNWRFPQIEKTANALATTRYRRVIDALCILEQTIKTKSDRRHRVDAVVRSIMMMTG
jgi:hypothetical protein